MAGFICFMVGLLAYVAMEIGFALRDHQACQAEDEGECVCGVDGAPPAEITGEREVA